MTTSTDLRDLAVDGLVGSTLAGSSVYSPRDQATWDGDYPVIFVRIDDEDGESFGRNGPPAFTVVSTLRVEARASRPGASDDSGAAQLLTDLETLREQIKASLINYTPLMKLLSQISFFRTRIVREPAEAADHMGAVVVELGMEFVQGPEDFFQPLVVPLRGIDVTVVEPDGTTEPGLTIDLPQS